MSDAEHSASSDALPDGNGDGDLAVQYEDLWYIKLINETDKNPLEKWGGYAQDFEESDTVYSHAEVLESDHENWGVVGIRGDDRYLLIFDLDVHKAPDDFDPDTVTAPSETTVVTSQNGGKHVYFIVHSINGEGKEADFTMEYDLGWDIDIRGSYVKHHVVAPAEIPGVGGLYELTNDATMLSVFDASDAADRIRYNDPESDKPHGEPLLEHSPAGGFGGDVEIDRDVEPPDEMPTCYHRGLQIRKQNPDDPEVNTHKINTLTGICGLAAGYSIEEMIEHFCEDYPPGENADTEETRYQLEHMAAKMDNGNLAPPKITTLRDYGILEEDEVCGCNIASHDDSILEMERTTDIDDVFLAIEYASSEAVSEVDETPVDHFDPFQVAAFEAGITDSLDEYPEGSDFFDALQELRDRGAHIPYLVSDDAADESVSSVEFGGPDVDSDEVVLALAGELQFAATRRDYVCRCPGCETALAPDGEHETPCDMDAVAMPQIIEAYKALLTALDREAQSRNRLRDSVSGWGPVHERVLDYLCEEGTVAPRGDS